MGWNFKDLDEIGDLVQLGEVVLEIKELMEEEQRQMSRAFSTNTAGDRHFFGGYGY